MDIKIIPLGIYLLNMLKFVMWLLWNQHLTGCSENNF